MMLNHTFFKPKQGILEGKSYRYHEQKKQVLGLHDIAGIWLKSGLGDVNLWHPSDFNQQTSSKKTLSMDFKNEVIEWLQVADFFPAPLSWLGTVLSA